MASGFTNTMPSWISGGKTYWVYKYKAYVYNYFQVGFNSGLINSRTKGWFFITGHSALILSISRPYSVKLRNIINLSIICHSLSSGFLYFFLAICRKQLIKFHWIFSTFLGSFNWHRSAIKTQPISFVKLFKGLFIVFLFVKLKGYSVKAT